MKITDTLNVGVIVAWYDLWVGIFIDTKKRRVYVFPVPCIGIFFDYAVNQEIKKGDLR